MAVREIYDLLHARFAQISRREPCPLKYITGGISIVVQWRNWHHLVNGRELGTILFIGEDDIPSTILNDDSIGLAAVYPRSMEGIATYFYGGEVLRSRTRPHPRWDSPSPLMLTGADDPGTVNKGFWTGFWDAVYEKKGLKGPSR